MRRLNAVNKKQAFKVVKELDAFPKVPDDYKVTTPSGGGVSIFAFIAIGILIISEIKYYSSTHLEFEYKVDTDMDGKLQINVDMTVAMRCFSIGADVVDVTGEDAFHFGQLEMEDTYFDLAPNQQRYHRLVKEVNTFLQQEYHALQEMMWISAVPGLYKHGMPPRDDQRTDKHDACRIHGMLEVNKVAGNFHVTAGKSVPVIPRGHAHLSMMLQTTDYNFSHRIDHFSFGIPVTGALSPLDGELQVTKNNYHMYQYFMQIVPTDVNTYRAKTKTFQFAVTEKNRTINHSEGSHGIPGIFVKYDLHPLMIKVVESHRPFHKFFIRLIGIIGGIFSVSGMLHSLTGFLMDIVCCQFKLGQYKKLDKDPNKSISTSSLTDNTIQQDLQSVNLLSSNS